MYRMWVKTDVMDEFELHPMSFNSVQEAIDFLTHSNRCYKLNFLRCDKSDHIRIISDVDGFNENCYYKLIKV